MKIDLKELRYTILELHGLLQNPRPKAIDWWNRVDIHVEDIKLYRTGDHTLCKYCGGLIDDWTHRASFCSKRCGKLWHYNNNHEFRERRLAQHKEWRKRVGYDEKRRRIV